MGSEKSGYPHSQGTVLQPDGSVYFRDYGWPEDLNTNGS